MGRQNLLPSYLLSDFKLFHWYITFCRHFNVTNYYSFHTVKLLNSKIIALLIQKLFRENFLNNFLLSFCHLNWILFFCFFLRLVYSLSFLEKVIHQISYKYWNTTQYNSSSNNNVEINKNSGQIWIYVLILIILKTLRFY